MTALLTSDRTEKRVLLAAIDAVGAIRPQEATEILAEFADSEDEEIAEAASEALMFAESDEDEDEEEGEESER